jgi:hypothetical protein
MTPARAMTHVAALLGLPAIVEAAIYLRIVEIEGGYETRAWWDAICILRDVIDGAEEFDTDPITVAASELRAVERMGHYGDNVWMTAIDVLRDAIDRDMGVGS